MPLEIFMPVEIRLDFEGASTPVEFQTVSRNTGGAGDVFY